MNYTREDYTRNILNTLRGLMEREEQKEEMGTLLTEAKDEAKAIPITDSPSFGQNVLSNQIKQFRSAVESGAQFSKPDESNVAECPLIYLPKSQNLVFSGVIPCLNNLKFQMVLRTTTGNGCFLFTDGLILSKDNLKILQKLQAYYQNWREEWISASGDLEQMAAHWKESH